MLFFCCFLKSACSSIFKTFFIFFYNSVEFIASIFGINNFVVKLVIAALYMILLSAIPDFISFFTCRIKKEYRKLKTKEEKKEYCSKHIHFGLKIFLTIKNNIANSINKLNAGIQSTQTVEEKSITAKERVTLLNSYIDKVSRAATNLTQLATQIEIVSNGKEIDKKYMPLNINQLNPLINNEQIGVINQPMPMPLPTNLHNFPNVPLSSFLIE